MAGAAKLKLRAEGIDLGAPIPAEYFGMHINHIPPTTIWADFDLSAADRYIRTPWPDIGIGQIRIWDADGCTWRNIERTNGAYTWDRLDYYLSMASAHGAKLIYHLGCGPDWATTADGQNCGIYVGYNPNPPADDSYWTAWCTAIATHLVHAGFTGAAYEIWNEVNDSSYGSGAVGSGYTGTVEQLVHLADLARTAIKAVDPTAIMLSPNFTGLDGFVGDPNDNVVRMDKYIACGGMDYADVVAIHGYNSSGPWTRPEGMIAFARVINGLLQESGIDLPIWTTEWGWGLWFDSAGDPHSSSIPMFGTAAPSPMPVQNAANYMTRLLVLNWLCGFVRITHYSFDAFNWTSLLMADAAAPGLLTAASTAFSYLRTLLTGGRLASLDHLAVGSNDYYRARFSTAAGRAGYVVWCDDYSTATLPIPGAVEIRDNLGGSVTVGSTLTVTGQPQFVFLS